jgi:hypothetical protein
VARRLPIENGSLFENAVKIHEICNVVADSDSICADRRDDRVEHTLAPSGDVDKSTFGGE